MSMMGMTVRWLAITNLDVWLGVTLVLKIAISTMHSTVSKIMEG